MDVSKYLEGDYVTVQLVKDSQSKKGIILSAGNEESYKDKTSLAFLVEVDTKRKTWKANKASLKNLVLKYGSESQNYVGKVVVFDVQVVNGKESVIGVPQ